MNGWCVGLVLVIKQGLNRETQKEEYAYYTHARNTSPYLRAIRTSWSDFTLVCPD
jgi:hypothetical protein